MTRHVSEDTLLKLVLGLLHARSESRVHNHLKECAACRDLMEDVGRTVGQLREVDPEVTAELPALPSAGHYRSTWMRIAAMLAVGFGLGFLASESLRPPSVSVVRQQIIPKAPEPPPLGFVACDQVDLSLSAR
jgi:predicted anti-sigma-YlaC factor YlaD